MTRAEAAEIVMSGRPFVYCRTCDRSTFGQAYICTKCHGRGFMYKDGYLEACDLLGTKPIALRAPSGVLYGYTDKDEAFRKILELNEDLFDTEVASSRTDT